MVTILQFEPRQAFLSFKVMYGPSSCGVHILNFKVKKSNREYALPVSSAVVDELIKLMESTSIVTIQINNGLIDGL